MGSVGVGGSANTRFLHRRALPLMTESAYTMSDMVSIIDSMDLKTGHLS